MQNVQVATWSQKGNSGSEKEIRESSGRIREWTGGFWRVREASGRVLENSRRFAEKMRKEFVAGALRNESASAGWLGRLR